MIYRLQLMRLNTTPILPPPPPWIRLVSAARRLGRQYSCDSLPTHAHKQLARARRIPQDRLAASLADDEQDSPRHSDEDRAPDGNIADPAVRRVPGFPVEYLRMPQHVALLIDGRHTEVPRHIVEDLEGRLERVLHDDVKVDEFRVGSGPDEIGPVRALQHPPLDLRGAVPRHEDLPVRRVEVHGGRLRGAGRPSPAP